MPIISHIHITLCLSCNVDTISAAVGCVECSDMIAGYSQQVIVSSNHQCQKVMSKYTLCQKLLCYVLIDDCISAFLGGGRELSSHPIFKYSFGVS